MKRNKRKFTASFKAQVVPEALKERQTINELAQIYEIHPNQIPMWKKEFLANADKIFGADSDRKQNLQSEKEKDELFKQIGQLKVENDWLKKNFIDSN